MESIFRLRAFLIHLLRSRNELHVHNEQEIFEELIVQKPTLQTLFDTIGPRSQQEQQEIQSGKTAINGHSLAINTSFAHHVLLLSQYLECSEHYAAALLHNITSSHPHLTPAQAVEAAVEVFHHRRRDLVDALGYLFEAAEAANKDNGVEAGIFTRLGKFVSDELVGSIQGSEASLASRIFGEIQKLGDLIARVDTLRMSAGSQTVVPSDQTKNLNQGTSALGSDVLSARFDSLKYERRTLASTLCTLGRLGYIYPSDLKVLIIFLSSPQSPSPISGNIITHSMTPYILTAILSVLNPVSFNSSRGDGRALLSRDRGLLSFMQGSLVAGKTWKDLGLKATVQLRWALFLIEARRRDVGLEGREGFTSDELEGLVWNGVQGGAFGFLTRLVMGLKRRERAAGRSTENLGREEWDWDFDITFRMHIFDACDVLVRELITHASSELRKIKQRQEDLVLANVRGERTRTNSGRNPHIEGENEYITGPPRNDVAVLYAFIGLLYSSLPPERALQFWGSRPYHVSTPDLSVRYMEEVEASSGRLPAFVQWAVWSTHIHDGAMRVALCEMLAGLAKGERCSELAYNFIARGGERESSPGVGTGMGETAVSWSALFSLLEGWASGSVNIRPPQLPQQHLGGGSQFEAPWQQQTHYPVQHQQLAIGHKEVLLARAFLRLLSTVVTGSVAVRLAISGHAHFRAIPTLVALIPLGIPLELKGAVFDTLASFCEPGAGVPGVEICKAVWTLMERLEVINVRPGPTGIGSFGLGFTQLKGVETELEEIEAVYRLYPATIPFLRLLSTLLHTPKRIRIEEKVIAGGAESLSTIPDSLGQPYRLPGIGPFVGFILDNVFARIATREYVHPEERWEMNDLCLRFIERALAGFEIDVLGDVPEIKSEVILPLLVHPGYEVTKRLLSNSALQASVLRYVVEGQEGLENKVREEPFFRSTVVRVLRIVMRVLEIQDIFLEVLVPLLAEFDSSPIVGTVHSRSYFTRFDQAIAFSPQYVQSLAAYVLYPAHPELVFLSIKILTILSHSKAFLNLTTLIEQSQDSDRILSRYRQILAVESVDDVLVAETMAEQVTGAGAPESEGGEEPLDQAIRLAALDLFIQNTDPRRPYPNIAHFLLFGGTNIEQIQDPHALGASQTCVHVILELVNAGVPRLKGKDKAQDHEQIDRNRALFVALPGLAERCYRVIYELCVHPHTSDFTMRYLRTREDFFARQLAVIPSQVPAALENPYAEVLYNDGSRVRTTVPALSSFLRLQSWIFDLTALDLHVLTNKGHFQGVTELLEILFGSDVGFYDESVAWEDNIHQTFREVGQSHTRIIEFVQSLNFEWLESLAVQSVDLQFLGSLDLHSCVRTDALGCEVIDRTVLLSLLTVARRALHAQGKITTAAHQDQLTAETTYILESCAVENHRREVRHAVAAGYEAWRRLLDMILTKCFNRLPHERRESMIFDLLHILPPAIRSTDIQESTAILLSETVLSSITKLREDRRHQIVVQFVGGEAEADALPAERLYAILHSILDCVLDNNRIELVRGNLYAALINYVHLVVSTDSPPKCFDQASSSLSLSASIAQENFLSRDNHSLASASRIGWSQTSPSLESDSLTLMKPIMERFVATIARDAIDGTEVWKSIAFMLLDALVQLSRLEKQHLVLSALVRHGILSNFVCGVRESDLGLQSILKPDPDDLNPLYVYEARMSLFIRMAQTRAGAEHLLEAQLLPVLAQSDYLDARPEANQSFMDHNTFLPSATQRYHQLFMPALQLVNAILATLGTKHAMVANQALDFLSSHQDTIVILLKNERDHVSLALVEEMHLLVSLCGNILHLVPRAELLAGNAGFGGIHSAILSLSTRCLGAGHWPHDVKPQTDAEVLSASIFASAYGSETNFEASAREKKRLLRKALVMYIGAASQFTEPEISLILSPVTTGFRKGADERGSRFMVTVPTIGDAIEALNEVCNDLIDTSKQIADLSAELTSNEHIRIDNIEEVISGSDAGYLPNLDIGQKRALICRELERIRGDAQNDAKILQSTMEMLLLLLWRHLAYYSLDLTEQYLHLAQQPSKISRSRSLAAPPATDVFRSDVRKTLAPILQRLAAHAGLDLGHDEFKGEGKGYVEVMCRRLKDCAGLHNNDSDLLVTG